MHDTGEGPAAEALLRVGVLVQQLGKRHYDLAEDLAALPCADQRRDPDIADERLYDVTNVLVQLGVLRTKPVEKI